MPSVKRKLGGGRKPLSDEQTVKLEIMLPSSMKVGLQYLAAQRSTWAQREVTVSEIVRDAIKSVLDGVTEQDNLDRDAAIEALHQEENEHSASHQN